MPAERLALILSQMRPDCILTDDKGRKALDNLDRTFAPEIDFSEASKTTVDEQLLDSIRARSGVYDPLSILYTSGSTMKIDRMALCSAYMSGGRNAPD